MNPESFPEAANASSRMCRCARTCGLPPTRFADKRARVVAELPDSAAFPRDAGRALKEDVLARLDQYLVEFESALTAAGGQVHWAADAAVEADAVVVEVAHAHGKRQWRWSDKSLTTDEIGVYEALAAAGNPRLGADFAELILQLDGDWLIGYPRFPRSTSSSEIRDLFARTSHPGELRRPARPCRGVPDLSA